MAVTAGMIAKVAATALSNEKLRKGIGWGLVAVLSPVILLISAMCSIGTGGADHNNQAVAAAFYGTNYSTEVPMAFRSHIEEMRSAFSLLDSAVASVNVRTEGGNSLDPIRVKAVFYALCFGEDAPSARAASRFVECFYTWETRTRTVDVENDDGTVTSMEEEYTVAVPVSLHQAYANLEAELGRTITEDDKSNIDHIYTMIAGTEGGGSYSGEFLRGGGSSIDLDISTFTDPNSKNAADLVTYAIHAWESGWGYVWGTYPDGARHRYRAEHLPWFRYAARHAPGDLGLLGGEAGRGRADRGIPAGLLRGQWFDAALPQRRGLQGAVGRRV